ncbi:NAD(P)H-binding protein [Mesorhizobium australicum]|uniref:NAD(P)H-binding protein n=1 Tax=Mesorhizobium australicum TaxID=536018 RepID=UPI003339437E
MSERARSVAKRARLLGEEGHDVVLTSRSVGSNALRNVRAMQADATDASELARVCQGADAIFMCAMATYHRWPTDFFPIIDGTVRAAEAVGAKLIVLGNLYGYGENADSPLRSDLSLNPTSKKGTARTIMGSEPPVPMYRQSKCVQRLSRPWRDQLLLAGRSAIHHRREAYRFHWKPRCDACLGLHQRRRQDACRGFPLHGRMGTGVSRPLAIRLTPGAHPKNRCNASTGDLRNPFLFHCRDGSTGHA